MLELPESLRGAFKEPLGPVYTDPESLLSAAGTPVVAVGDVVTYHLRRVGRDPDVAVVDGRTKREAVDEPVRAALDGDNPRIAVENPPGTIGRELLSALATAVRRDDHVVVEVDGEEDLAALPAVLVTPLGGSVVYGQPDEGMVLVRVTPAARAEVEELLRRMDGDADAALDVLEAGGRD